MVDGITAIDAFSALQKAWEPDAEHDLYTEAIDAGRRDEVIAAFEGAKT